MPSVKEQEERDRECTFFGRYKDKAKCLTCIVEDECIDATKDIAMVERGKEEEKKMKNGYVTINGMEFKWE